MRPADSAFAIPQSQRETNTAIGEQLFLSERMAQGNARRIVDQVGPPDTRQDNRRVLAVLAFGAPRPRVTRSVWGLTIRTG